MTVEKLGVPTAPVCTEMFVDLARTIAYKKGMPNQRITFVPHPVSGRPASLCRKYLEGNNPITGKPVMQEIVEALTAPLTEEQKKTGFLERTVPRLVGSDTEENLHQLFFNNGWTDGLPIVLPTERRVAEMLKGTSHPPNQVVGRMRPSPPHEAWEYTVEKVAINAVMAGAKPEYFPVILALASTGVTSLFSSTTSFARMVVVNGPICDQIKMNSGMGAMGPFNHANATIGRAWTLMSINLGGGAVLGETYLGSQGNNLNYNNICFAENEKRLPPGWQPFHVQKGFKPEESAVSVFTGWQLVHQFGTAETKLPRRISSVLGTLSCSSTGTATLTGIATSGNTAGASVLLDPLIAKDLKEIEGFGTKEKLSQWLHQNTLVTVGDYWNTGTTRGFTLPMAQKGVEPFASYLKLPKDALIPRLFSPETINIIVVGGETNPMWQAGDLKYLATTSIDKWR